jgi:molecular chaperone DnaK (HSP70)
MRLGIDFGTTWTAVAGASDGRYPVASFSGPDGDLLPGFPSVVASDGSDWCFGTEALAREGDGDWTLFRSVKRLMVGQGPLELIQIGSGTRPLIDVLTGFAAALRRALLEDSNLDLSPTAKLEAMLAVPATANSNQRYLTLEAFKGAGFQILGLVDEPTAAGIEYAHRYRRSGLSRRETLVVYDLGGGTFDASVIELTSGRFEVLVSEGLGNLGGDDFDAVLAALATTHEPALEALSVAGQVALKSLCREAKESLQPNTRRMILDVSRLPGAPDLGLDHLVLKVADYYQRLESLLQQAQAAVERALDRAGSGEIPVLYVVGGAASLPLIPRSLRSHYGERRVKRSPDPHAAVAVGLAVAAEAGAEMAIKGRIGRHFGVWREAEAGRDIVFDPIFPKDTPLPGPGDPLVVRRCYRPAHNIAHFRYLECTQFEPVTGPDGDVTPWDEVFFPLMPELIGSPVDRIPITSRPELAEQEIEECYRCDSNGLIEVTIANRSAGYERTFRLRR